MLNRANPPLLISKGEVYMLKKLLIFVTAFGFLDKFDELFLGDETDGTLVAAVGSDDDGGREGGDPVLGHVIDVARPAARFHEEVDGIGEMLFNLGIG